MATAPSLRDTLAEQLSALPNASALHLIVLASTPKRTTALFPHAPSSAVRCWESEHLAVVYCDVPPASTDTEPGTNGTTSSTSTAPSKVLAAAISFHIYTLPTTSDSPSSLVYISKVDSSGYAPAGPLTRALASGVLVHELAAGTRPGGARGRVAATLFARSQGQYLFPNSVEGGGKRVLGGLGLCQWWKGVYEDAARALVDAGENVHLAYLLPSYSAAEAAGMVGAPRRPLPPRTEWAYAPPFRHPLFPRDTPSLATLIPSLPDDPKTRFLQELVDSAEDASPYHHRERKGSSKSDELNGGAAPSSPKKSKSRKELEAEDDEEQRRRAHAALAKLDAEEFWERMGFRQECASGDVTGFFSMSAGPSAAAASAEANAATTEQTTRFEPPKPPHTLPQALVERVLKSMLNTDFATRALAYSGTEQWLATTRALVVDAVGEDGWAASTATIVAKTDAPAPPPKRKEETVTVLQPRKKKK